MLHLGLTPMQAWIKSLDAQESHGLDSSQHADAALTKGGNQWRIEHASTWSDAYPKSDARPRKRRRVANMLPLPTSPIASLISLILSAKVPMLQVSLS